MTDILVTNDDGFMAPGFQALFKALCTDYHAVGVAPTIERSWIGKSISAHDKQVLKKESENLYSFTGTPADCVQVGIYNVLKKQPKLVVSGINKGANAGHSRMLSSGTIGAAMEASIDGVKSIALSIHVPEKNSKLWRSITASDYLTSAKISHKLVRIFLDTDFPAGVDLLSINIPFDATMDTPFEVTVPDRQPMGQLFHDKGDHHLHSCPPYPLETSQKGTDLRALHEGKISITPVSLELVSRSAFDELQKIIDKVW